MLRSEPFFHFELRFGGHHRRHTPQMRWSFRDRPYCCPPSALFLPHAIIWQDIPREEIGAEVLALNPERLKAASVRRPSLQASKQRSPFLRLLPKYRKAIVRTAALKNDATLAVFVSEGGILHKTTTEARCKNPGILTVSIACEHRGLLGKESRTLIDRVAYMHVHWQMAALCCAFDL